MNTDAASLLAQVIPVFLLLINVDARFSDHSWMNYWVQVGALLARWLVSGCSVFAVITCIGIVLAGDVASNNPLLADWNSGFITITFIALMIYTYVQMFILHGRDIAVLGKLRGEGIVREIMEDKPVR